MDGGLHSFLSHLLFFLSSVHGFVMLFNAVSTRSFFAQHFSECIDGDAMAEPEEED